MEEYFAAKAVLFTPSHARRGVVNADDAWGRRLVRDPAIPITTFGLDEAADVRARAIEVRHDGVAFTRRRRASVRSALRGRFNASNCLGAVAVASALGIPLVDAARGGGLGAAACPAGWSRSMAGQGFAVVVDYAHTPDSILNVLRGARALAAGRVIVVFGCGGDRDRAKRPLMGRTAAAEADLSVVTSDNPRSEDPASIIEEIVAGMPPGGVLRSWSPIGGPRSGSRCARRATATSSSSPARDTRPTRRSDGAVVPFDDRVVAREAIAARSEAR